MKYFQDIVAVKPISQSKHTDISKSATGTLPAGTDVGKWCHSLISTYIQVVSSSANPWDIPPKYAIEVLQKLWDIFFPDIPQIVTMTSPIYKKVCYSVVA